MGQPVVHFEITGTDVGRHHAFYSQLFGWSIDLADPDATAAPVTYGIVACDDNLNARGVGIAAASDRCPTDRARPRHHLRRVARRRSGARGSGASGRNPADGPRKGHRGPRDRIFADPEGHVIGVTRGGS